ncbi:MAG TPA: response regulator, partial [Candidatus Kapabacteria bacterium]|nr:response regulator [Candidatus Kapabacteria bacterium]
MTYLGAVILVVDDDEAGRYTKSRILKFSGFEVCEAATGKEALDSTSKIQPDLVLLDVNLPDISGYEVCRRLKSDAPTAQIPVVLTSAAFTKGADRARGLEGGADGYLIEPTEPEVIQATIMSILRSREAMEVSRQATMQWEATFAAISDGIALLDGEGIIYRCNQAFRRLSHGENAIGVSLESWLIHRNAHVPFSLASGMQAVNKQSHELEFDSRWFELSLDPMGTTKAEGTVAICKDITSRREAERELIGSRNIAETANAAKDRFLAVLSHELRTPLTPALMSVDVMMGDPQLPMGMREGLEMIQRNIELEARLIDDLLDLTRIIQGKMSLRMIDVDLCKLASLAIEMSKEEITSKGILLRVELGEAQAIVNCDPARMQQVLWNLIKNAAKFTPSGGTIDIVARRPGPD